MFILSKYKPKGSSEKKFGYHISYDKSCGLYKSKDYLLLTDEKIKKPKALIEALIKDKSTLFKSKNNISGALLTKTGIIIFNDQLGLKDIYYSRTGDIVTNDYYSLIKMKKHSINRSAMVEFLHFDHPLYDNTFLHGIYILPLASVYELKADGWVKNHYWVYRLESRKNLSMDFYVEKVYSILKDTAKNIKKEYRQKKLALGLSGGMDSRLEAYMLHEEGLNPITYTFGEKDSDAVLISKKIAKKISSKHFSVGYDKDFYRSFDKCFRYNPMGNLLYSWYYASSINFLKDFDIHIHGFNGDNQFGSHIITNDKLDNTVIVGLLLKKYGIKTRYKLPQVDLKKLSAYLKKIGGSTVNKTENFNYNFRQLRFIKNSPVFHCCGEIKSISLFEQPEFIEFMNQVPYRLKKDLILYKALFKEKLTPMLKIRLDRGFRLDDSSRTKNLKRIIRYIDTRSLRIYYKKTHKPVDKWIYKNKGFYIHCKNILNARSALFKSMFPFIDPLYILDQIYKGKSNEIALFFRLLTIKKFLIEVGECVE